MAAVASVSLPKSIAHEWAPTGPVRASWLGAMRGQWFAGLACLAAFGVDRALGSVDRAAVRQRLAVAVESDAFGQLARRRRQLFRQRRRGHVESLVAVLLRGRRGRHRAIGRGYAEQGLAL